MRGAPPGAIGDDVQEDGAPSAMDDDALRSAPPDAPRDLSAAVAWGAILAAAGAPAAGGSAPALGAEGASGGSASGGSAPALGAEGASLGAAGGSAPALGAPLGAVVAPLSAFPPSALGNFASTGGALPLGDFAPTGGVLGAPLGAAGASLGTCAPLGAVGASLGTFAPTALGHFAPAGGAPGCASLGAFAPRWRARSRRCRRRVTGYGGVI